MGCHVTLTLLYFGWSLSSSSDVPPRTYYYINQSMTWFQAQIYCREHYTDLATFDSYDDINMLEPTLHTNRIWIGLFYDPKSWKENLGNESNSWRWSVTGDTGQTTFKAWASGEPSFEDPRETCVVMNPDGTWADKTCFNGYTFVCYTVINQSDKVYHFIPTVKSWNSAREYCRQNYADLAMIENADENVLVFSKTGNLTSWIGLYRVPWTWSDRSHSTFRNWDHTQQTQQTQQNYRFNRHCVAESWADHKWFARTCSQLWPFICHQVTRLETTVGMQIMTDADMTDPAVIEQFLQEIHTRLTNLGWTDFKLRWRNLPLKKTKKT